MTVRPPLVRVTIDRLALKGFPPDQRDAIARGLTEALSEAFRAPDVAGFGGASIARLRLAPLQIGPTQTPQALGAAAGRTVAGGIRR